MGNASSEMIEKMDVYAENLGLSFQIADDILDVVGNVEELGKNVGQDQKDNKNTYTSIYGLDAAYKRLDELSKAALDAIADYYDNAEFFSKLIDELKNRTK
jgi:geranylgeranyl diphosphate synthase type II